MINEELWKILKKAITSTDVLKIGPKMCYRHMASFEIGCNVEDLIKWEKNKSIPCEYLEKVYNALEKGNMISYRDSSDEIFQAMREGR